MYKIPKLSQQFKQRGTETLTEKKAGAILIGLYNTGVARYFSTGLDGYFRTELDRYFRTELDGYLSTQLDGYFRNGLNR